MRRSLVIGGFVAAGLLLSLIAVKAFEHYNTRIYPKTYINGIAVGGLTIEEATSKLQQAAFELPDGEVVIAVDDIRVASTSAGLGAGYYFDEVAREAFENGKSGNLIQRFFSLISSLFKNKYFSAHPQFNSEQIESLLTELKLKVDIIGERPSAVLAVSGAPTSLKINPGIPGRLVEVEKTIVDVQENLKDGSLETRATVASTSAALTDEEQIAARDRALAYVGTSIVFDDERLKFVLSDRDIVSFLTFPTGIDTDEILATIDTWKTEIDREPQDAVFEYNPETLTVAKFVPPRDGLVLDTAQTLYLIQNSIDTLANPNRESAVINHSLPLATKPPDKTLADTNDLGISERIGFGESEYDHSIPNRIHNVKITTDRISNTIVPPGAEFSFNKTLGEVSARTGYRSAYVIRNGRTELGDGGGVCQVSTTLFRAVLNAGLPVTRRLPHSYRVSYYELDSKPGIDATVYSGDVDLRFINDTNHHILVHGEADSNNLYMYFEIYGTSDGRTTQIVDHEVWGYQPPPPPQYFEDPEKPPGYREQVDWSAAGIKAKFKNIVKNAAGEVIREEEYYSNYRPWAAKFVVGPGGTG
jgi:vancomycin resistance protein YoaR